MVLWELTLGTAYFLGLKRTYRLALKIQRKLISPKHTKIRQFAHRRTRAVFDVAIKVHRNVQERDLEVGRNLGNRILRWLDRMKPSAEIRPKPSLGDSASSTAQKQLTNSSQKTTTTVQRNGARTEGHESDRHFFTSSRNIWPKSFPSISKMVRTTKPAGINTQYRHLSVYNPPGAAASYGGFGRRGAIREDILQWMLRN
ncbi:OLC1v1031136C1 [Oldenlandia corymbosa var. corymbosa]|uniref:OLC1v1031136C1 n=1 Tax=Oldenlandia corymbosa var. corymbosa TaxID=529605 RepID=A0AAV1CJI3_OLDCO|nr:OLC1v1031136C1 [Oldenlandia corymbosa var. corymbosa]